MTTVGTPGVTVATSAFVVPGAFGIEASADVAGPGNPGLDGVLTTRVEGIDQ